MGARPAVTAQSESAPPDVCPAPESFWLWVLDALQLSACRRGEDVYEVAVPEGRRDDFDGREMIRFRWGGRGWHPARANDRVSGRLGHVAPSLRDGKRVSERLGHA